MSELSNAYTDASSATDNRTDSPVPQIPQYYRVKDVARKLALSEKSIIRRFKDDPDVLVMSEPRKGVRKYKTYLVPEVSILRLIDNLRPRGRPNQ